MMAAEEVPRESAPHLEPRPRARRPGCAALGARWPQLSRLTDQERAEVHRLIEEMSMERAVRAETHLVMLERVARSLGRKVGRHEVTLADATRRLEVLASRPDATFPVPKFIVPYRDACEIMLAAFAAGAREASP